MGAITEGIIRYPSDNKGRERVEVFWEQVRKTNSCWLWVGCKSEGYGNFHNDGAHRVSFRLSGKEIPEGKFVLHSCDVRACVNPKHLYIGTHKQNMRDASIRKRWPEHKGEKSYFHKLTDKNVKKIRFLNGKLSGRKVAKMFSMSHSTVGLIWQRKRWGHI